MEINYIEHTGPLTRVGVIETDEETACVAAMEALGTMTGPFETTQTAWGWEVIFDKAEMV